MKPHGLTNQIRKLKSDACIIPFEVFIYNSTYKPDRLLLHWIQYFIFNFFAVPWVACPGDGGSLSIQDYEKQSVLRLT